MNKNFSFLFLLLFTQIGYAQQWVDTLYQYQLTSNVVYGMDTDFAGNIRPLTLDVCMPLNDVPPTCGRPLLVSIHGGAFMAGTKNDPSPHQWMIDFAKRGYVSISINYRLGMFQTDNFVHCNISQLYNTAWDCSNMADTNEWFRAYFRAIQDVKGAIRYMVNSQNQYNLDVRNVFLVGESAGGFIALGTTFLDDESEKMASCFSINDVNPPNGLYENQCIQAYGFDTSIASMNLTRPNLGSIDGDLNLTAPPYMIKAVGNFYGGVLTNLFSVNNYTNPPTIYLFHQPNDLVVPYNRNKVLEGVSNCATFLGCQSLINRPIVYGSAGIKALIDEQVQLGQLTPVYVFDSTLNNTDCAGQIFNPSLTGHSIDDYSLRTLHLAQLFASKIDTSSIHCNVTSGINLVQKKSHILIYPNPINDYLKIESNEVIYDIDLFSLSGFCLKKWDINLSNQASLSISSNLPNGFYLLSVNTESGKQAFKISILH